MNRSRDIPLGGSLPLSPFCIRSPIFPCTAVPLTFYSLLRFQPGFCVLEGSPLTHCCPCPCPCPILLLPILSLQSSFPPALQPCLSLSAAWRRAWAWIAASPGSCCLWGPPSTWMALLSMRPWQPSLLLKSTTMSSTWARSPQSGEMMMSLAGQDRLCVQGLQTNFLFIVASHSYLRYIIMYMQISLNMKNEKPTRETFLVSRIWRKDAGCSAAFVPIDNFSHLCCLLSAHHTRMKMWTLWKEVFSLLEISIVDTSLRCLVYDLSFPLSPPSAPPELAGLAG